MKKYEVKTIGAYEFLEDHTVPHANNLLREAQEEGWEIAGPIEVITDKQSYYRRHLTIPLKRELRTEPDTSGMREIGSNVWVQDPMSDYDNYRNIKYRLTSKGFERIVGRVCNKKKLGKD